MLDRLYTKGKYVLAHKNAEQGVTLKKKESFSIVGTGRKTVHDILSLQVKIKFSVDNTQTFQAAYAMIDREVKKISPFRIRVRSLEREHWPSDPADWSLLSHSCLELLNKNTLLPDFLQKDCSENISDLGLTENDFLKLCNVAVLPDDKMEILLSTSIGYLLQTGVCKESFNKVIAYIALRCNSLLSNCEVVTDTPIFYNINLLPIRHLRIRYAWCDDIKPLLNNASPQWFDVNILSERQILEVFGFNYKGCRAVSTVWKLKEEAYKLTLSLANSLPMEAFNSFEGLIELFVQRIIKKPDHFSVVMGRLGFLEGRKWTLEELGQKLNVTRERIRQIEKKYFDILESPKVLELLNLLWHTIDDVLVSGGGVCCPSEIAAFLKQNWSWTSAPSDDALSALISICPKYEVVWTEPVRVIVPEHGCVNCQEIGAIFTKAVEEQPTGTLSFDEARNAMRAYCEEKSCRWLADVSQFSDGYLHFLDDAIEEIFADEDTLYTQYAWTQKYGKRRLLLFEALLKNANRPMHFTEVHTEINKDRPQHAQFSERSVYGNLERSAELLLWGPGTFIHRDLVRLPTILIHKIKTDIVSRLKNDNIPYLSITGLFELYKDSLLKEGIPNAHALYTCLKLTASDSLICLDYPYVLSQLGDGVRLAVPLVLEEFVLEQEGVVTLEQLRRHAIEKLCVNEAVFMVNHLVNIPNLIRVDRGEYIHFSNVNIDVEDLSSITEHLHNLLKKTSHVSVVKLYDDKKISCRLLGITTPIFLYSLIDYLFYDQFDISRYPKIGLCGQCDDGIRSTGVTKEVIGYVRGKNTPCSFSELYEHFVDSLGYKQLSIYNAQMHNDILRYSEGVIVHVATLDWNDEKQEYLENIAGSYLNDRLNSGKLFGLITDIYEYHFDKLPILPDHICWTAMLIGALLSKSGKFRIIGTSRNAFVAEPNAHGISTLDDLLSCILDTKYYGAANIDQFIVDMRDAGILKKSLTPVMLKEDGPVIIDRNVVKLARLS